MDVGNISRDFISTEESLTVKDSATVPYLVVVLNSVATGVDLNIPVTLFGSSVVAEIVIIEEIV